MSRAPGTEFQFMKGRVDDVSLDDLDEVERIVI